MATEASKFQVGVFVIAAVFIGVGSLIWLGASRFFEETVSFVTYFSESVQGLEPGSAVKYRGVPAGRVGRIRIAPDGDLIEVIMDIDSETAEFLRGDKSLRAKLELSGITGLRYIEIERRSGDELNQAPVLSFQPPYEVIGSSRSSFQAIQQALSNAYDSFMSLDFKGISNDTRSTLQSARRVLEDERIPTVIANLERTSAAAAKLATNMEEMTADLKLAPVVDNANAATAEAKELFAQLNRVTGTEVAEAAAALAQLAQSAQQMVAGLQYSIDRLDRTVTSLKGLTEEVREQPSLLLFAEPPPQRVVPPNREAK
jgi:ABC-type transporter Mla subunit MlaD